MGQEDQHEDNRKIVTRLIIFNEHRIETEHAADRCGNELTYLKFQSRTARKSTDRSYLDDGDE